MNREKTRTTTTKKNNKKVIKKTPLESEIERNMKYTECTKNKKIK